jgi:hypothetical protein
MMREKPCENPACHNLIQERPRHGGKEFEGRQFCCHACSVAIRRKTLLVEKPCAREGCDQLVRPRENDRPNKFAARKFCSTKCQRLTFGGMMNGGWSPGEAAEWRRKPCKRCTNEVVQYPNEGIKKWEGRQYCCKACSRAAREEHARIAKAPTGTRRKGDRQPRETRIAQGVGLAEKAAAKLRSHGPVWPLCTVLDPYKPPSSSDTHWHVNGRVMAVEEMIKMAGLA